MTTSTTVNFATTQESLHDQDLRSQQSFSCVIIGETSLPVQCAEILRQARHRIQAVISDDPEFLQWARSHQIPVYHFKDDWSAHLTEQTFDYLFSIINPRILPREILSRPSQLAINYHDAPLPKYAGLHASTWALLQREVGHGVTWHVMAEEVDAGDILKQRRFPIAPDETSLSLNLKCYEAAIAAFQELIGELAQQRFSRTPQDLTQRTYFSQQQRPPGGAVISWHSPAEEIARLCRALSFGPYLNPLTCPKLQLSGDFFIVVDYELHKSLTPAPAGTIRAIQSGSITIATTTDDFAIKSLLSLAGIPISLDHIVEQYGLQVGQQLTDLAPEVLNELTQHEYQIAKHEEFWRRRLATTQPAQLPHTSQLVNNFVATSVLSASFSLPATANTTCRQSWNREHLFLTVVAVYLSRLSATSPFDIGFTSSAQKEDDQHLAPLRKNFFAPQVPFRIALDLNASFAEAYAVIEREVALCTKRQTYTRDLVVRDPELRKLSTTNLTASVAVVLFPYTGDEEPSAQRRLTLYVKTNTTTRETSAIGNIEITFAYNPDVITPEVLARMVGHLQVLFHAAASHPETAISTLPLLTEAERHQLLIEWNNTKVEYPKDKCIHELFTDQTERTPDAVAVVCGEQQVTYRELNVRANQLAHHLEKLGVHTETLVGICLDRSLELVVGLLAILKAGGAYVPVDPAYPPERIDFMLKDAVMPVVLTQQRLVDLFCNHQIQTFCFDRDWAMLRDESATNPANHTTATHLAYVIYTSGSTGQPKGTLIEHQAIAKHCLAIRDHYELCCSDRVLQFSSLSFDAALEQVLPPLISGAAVVLRDQELWQPGEVLEQLATLRITVADFPTAYWRQVLQALNLTSSQPRSGIPRLMIVGGEAMFPNDLNLWKSTPLRSVRLLNAYGPTETTITATTFDVASLLTASPLPPNVPIGRPLANRQVFILDPAKNPVPIGVPGELYIGGDGVARGYLNRPELTAEKFLPNPFSAEPGARLYRTGDMARYLPDGKIEFLGRQDDQVKIRGYRIELGEIETVVRTHPAVHSVVVVAREDRPGDKRVVAYVVAHQGTTLTASELRSFLQQTLPEYMVPTVFVLLDAFLLTANGKVDRKALPTPQQSRGKLTEAFVAPRTTLEEIIATVWCAVLSIERVGIYDNFFELGGHSLLATQVVTRLANTLQTDLPLRDLFEAPTVSMLAQRLQANKEKRAGSQGIKVTRVARERYRVRHATGTD